ncbi:MAG: zf-HC2 domain-containing protein [Phycisphaerae bacterium]
MDCERIQAQLGLYLDEEMASDQRREVEEHLAGCPACSAELGELRALVSELAGHADVPVPDAVWSAIERRLDVEPARSPRTADVPFFRMPIAKVAAVILAVGLGLLALAWPEGGVSKALASEVNFSVLLDALPVDARKAFTKFLVLYDAQKSSPFRARQYAPGLNFDLPNDLPGGFRLETVYLLRFGDRPGIAATYGRDDDFLGVVFHRPVQRENFGRHKDYPCVIGKHRGHKVSIGEWRLVHLTGPTTCHCVLSRLNEHTELPAIMAAVAPMLSASSPHGHGR